MPNWVPDSIKRQALKNQIGPERQYTYAELQALRNEGVEGAFDAVPSPNNDTNIFNQLNNRPQIDESPKNLNWKLNAEQSNPNDQEKINEFYAKKQAEQAALEAPQQGQISIARPIQEFLKNVGKPSEVSQLPPTDLERRAKMNGIQEILDRMGYKQ